MATITSATAIYILGIAGLFTPGVQLSGWAVDEAFDTETVDAAETQLGVDGTGVSGWIPREVPQTISLLATSPSAAVFDAWIAAEDAIQDVIYATGNIRIPSLGLQYSMPQGTLKRYQTAPNAKKVFMMRSYTIVWQPQPGISAMTVAPI